MKITRWHNGLGTGDDEHGNYDYCDHFDELQWSDRDNCDDFDDNCDDDYDDMVAGLLL